MGGGSVQVDSNDCECLKSDKEVQTILQKGNLSQYIEAMNDHNYVLLVEFANSWKSNIVYVRGISFHVMMELIEFFMGLPLDGVMIPNKVKFFLSRFHEQVSQKSEKVNRLQNGFDGEDLLGIQKKIAKVLMR